VNAAATRLLGRVEPFGFGGFPNTHTTAALYRAYLWGKRNQDRLAVSGQMAFSNVVRELERRGVQLRSQQ
jgi:hypothetical protein